jgi:hypothetical protein
VLTFVAGALAASEQRAQEAMHTGQVSDLQQEIIERTEELADRSRELAESNRLLALKSDELATFASTTLAQVTGGDSFPVLKALRDGKGGWKLAVASSGEHPMYEVEVFLSANVKVRSFSVGNVPPYRDHYLDATVPVPRGKHQTYGATMIARNGTVYQQTCLARTAGGWKEQRRTWRMPKGDPRAVALSPPSHVHTQDGFPFENERSPCDIEQSPRTR